MTRNKINIKIKKFRKHVRNGNLYNMMILFTSELFNIPYDQCKKKIDNYNPFYGTYQDYISYTDHLKSTQVNEDQLNETCKLLDYYYTNPEHIGLLKYQIISKWKKDITNLSKNN